MDNSRELFRKFSIFNRSHTTCDNELMHFASMHLETTIWAHQGKGDSSKVQT